MSKLFIDSLNKNNYEIIIYDPETRFFHLGKMFKTKTTFKTKFSLDDVYAVSLQSAKKKLKKTDRIIQKHVNKASNTQVTGSFIQNIYLILNNGKLIKLNYSGIENNFEDAIVLLKAIASTLNINYFHGESIQQCFFISKEKDGLPKISFTKLIGGSY